MSRSALLLTLGFVCSITPAIAADVTGICTLASDKRTVTVAFTNPNPQVMACEVNCDMALPGGFGAVVCVKSVPGGAKDQILCTDVKEGAVWVRVRESEIKCRDPNASGASDPAAKDDDEDADELIRKLQKQGQDFINRQKE
jgi:hypothetical protein